VHKLASIATFAVLLATLASPARAATLQPAEHGDFSYYTFALTWQPGFCNSGTPCLDDQPHSAPIGLHGLWASLPGTLSATGITSPQWWDRGCDYFAPSDAAPAIDAPLQARLSSVMPHLASSLLTHEYDKHVRCFGFDASAFFTTELAMLDAVAASSFGRDLVEHEGGEASHAAIVAAFESAFATTSAASLQLRCTLDPVRGPQLEQLWITIDAAKLDEFPAAAALIDAPIAQDTCPASFHLPAWNASGFEADVPQNLGELEAAVAAYYGDGRYDAQVRAIEADAQRFLDGRVAAGEKKPALVLDIDDTSLSTLGYELAHGFAFDPTSWNVAAERGFPPIESTLDLAKHAAAEGVAVIFITGRRSTQERLTRKNLSDAGYSVTALYMRPPGDHALSVVAFKSSARAAVEARGYTVVESIGDQWSDLAGGHAERDYKLPNPMYVLP
jgi:ribonuclease I